MDKIQQCYDKLKANEKAKNVLLDEMMSHLKLLTDDQQSLRKELQDTKTTAATYAKKWEEARAKVESLEKSIGAKPFTLVLVDGNGLTFVDDLVKRGSEGGEEAARILRITIIEYLQHDQNIPAGTETVIRVFANIAGLGKTFSHHKILPSPDDFDSFIRGFNSAIPLCDYVDAGNDQEATNNKIKGDSILHAFDDAYQKMPRNCPIVL